MYPSHRVNFKRHVYNSNITIHLLILRRSNTFHLISFEDDFCATTNLLHIYSILYDRCQGIKDRVVDILILKVVLRTIWWGHFSHVIHKDGFTVFSKSESLQLDGSFQFSIFGCFWGELPQGLLAVWKPSTDIRFGLVTNATEKSFRGWFFFPVDVGTAVFSTSSNWSPFSFELWFLRLLCFFAGIAFWLHYLSNTSTGFSFNQ